MAAADEALSRHELEARIVKRCWENDAFRKELTSDPAGTFSKYLGVGRSTLPSIVVHQEEPGTWHIVLPARPGNARELSDADLEQVAGGATPISLLATVLASVISGLVGGSAASAAVTVNKGW